MIEYVLIIDGEETIFKKGQEKEFHRAYIEADRFDHVDKRVTTYTRMSKIAGDDTPGTHKWFKNVYSTDHCERVEKEIREERAEKELSACGDNPHS